MPREADYRYLLDMEQRGLLPNRRALKEYEAYFKLVVDSVPYQADAYGMLGYCQYYLGKEKEAVQSYTAAIRINPTFMGYHYNLAVIYYNREEYGPAVMHTKEALQASAPLTAQAILSSSRIYMLVIAQMSGNPPESIIRYMTEERQRILELGQEIQGRLQEAKPLFLNKKRLRLI
jgi:tetratricopeptide (TPR) repeat protein